MYPNVYSLDDWQTIPEVIIKNSSYFFPESLLNKPDDNTSRQISTNAIDDDEGEDDIDQDIEGSADRSTDY